MDELVQYFALFSLISGVTYYTVIRMKKSGIIFTLVTYLKWLVGFLITFFAFYIIYVSGNYLEENNISVVFSLPTGIIVWFIPMHYTTKLFMYLEDRYKKED